MNIPEYLESIGKRYALGNATEHTFRGDLQTLIESLASGTAATNEPKRIACGAPDYVVTRKDIPVGYVEAKDIGEDLTGAKIKEQRDRYKNALDNLIFTDYLDFHLYRGGQLKVTVRIAEVQGGKIVANPEAFDQFAGLIKEFASHRGQTIKSSKTLAEMMAEKAKMLAFIIHNALGSDEESDANSTLKDQMSAFKQVLIHDLDAKSFADVYAQTIAYGMFAARLHDSSLESFSRREAAELIPKTNPFLRKLFNNIATDIDERIEWIVDALADVYRAADIAAILKNFGRSTQTHDPIMHFYETFLAAYDPKLRKSRGVFYTPEPVVDFIVRAVDDILKTEFGLPMGLADTSKTKIKLKTTVKDERTKSGYREEEKEVHRVQILDPATGTGTFLAQVIKQVHKSFAGQQGVWAQYVDEHLIPRLNGFELLMASYAMAHLKLDLLLAETGYGKSQFTTESTENTENDLKNSVPSVSSVVNSSSASQRFRVYLTNALEEYHPETGTLWASWLSAEANEANHIKRDTPVMVVIGNPPYSGESSNKGDWIMSLMEDYKKEPGGKEKLKERNPKWINDDYVKFLRFGQHFIEKNGEGILAFINPHGFLDNPTFRGMRWNLLKTYDKIYTIDLHGNSKKKETAPDGSVDENVFDIQQGVSINLLIKTGKKPQGTLGQLFHYDLFGKREEKYSFLTNESLGSVPYVSIPNIAPNYFIMQKDFAAQELFNSGFSVNELFPANNVGIVTANDSTLVGFERNELTSNVSSFYDKSTSDEFVKPIAYRPFDQRRIYYDTSLIERSREKLMRHFLLGENVGLNWIRPMSSKYEFSVFISNTVTDQCSAGNKSAGAGISYLAPIYLYSDDDGQRMDQPTLGSGSVSASVSSVVNSDGTLNAQIQDTENTERRVPNLNMEIVGKIAEKLGLEFVAEKGGNTSGSECASSSSTGTLPTGRVSASGADQSFAPIDILDYIYAVLHSPAYREKYKEFLKIDFPRVPYPKDAETFWRLVKLGGEIRQIHLLDTPTVNQFITGYPVGGGNDVTKIEKRGDNVFINQVQHFSGVPTTAWNFYIGGYQPAQKWLKDRKGRQLNFDDIQHYQKIIVALTETDRLMKEIDEIDFID
jgi:predicted helicase